MMMMMMMMMMKIDLFWQQHYNIGVSSIIIDRHDVTDDLQISVRVGLLLLFLLLRIATLAVTEDEIY